MRPENVNRLIVVCGPPCSGKTVIAGEIAARLSVPHLEVDRIRAAILPHSRSSESDRDIGYRAMHMTATYLLKPAGGIILDATYGRPEHMTDLKALAIESGAALFIIQCKVSPDIAGERFLRRRDPHPAVDLDEARVRRLAEEYPYDEATLVVDTTQSTEKTLQIIQSYLSRNPRRV